MEDQSLLSKACDTENPLEVVNIRKSALYLTEGHARLPFPPKRIQLILNGNTYSHSHTFMLY